MGPIGTFVFHFPAGTLPYEPMPRHPMRENPRKARTIAAPEDAPVVKAVRAFQERLVERLEDLCVPPTPDDVLCETMAAARVAAASGDMDTAIKGFRAVGDMLGLTAASQATTHNHLHLHQASHMLEADDATLSNLILAAKTAQPAATQPESTPHCAKDPDPHRFAKVVHDVQPKTDFIAHTATAAEADPLLL